MKRKISLIAMLSVIAIFAWQTSSSNAAVQQMQSSTSTSIKRPANDNLNKIEIEEGTVDFKPDKESDKTNEESGKNEDASSSNSGSSLSGMESKPSAGFSGPTAGSLHESVYGNSGNISNSRGYKFVPSESAAKILNSGEKK